MPENHKRCHNKKVLTLKLCMCLIFILKTVVIYMPKCSRNKAALCIYCICFKMYAFFVFYNYVQRTIQFLSHFLLFLSMVPSHSNNKIACRHLEEPESPYVVYFQVDKVEFSFHTFLFLPHSLEEWINFHQWMFSKGHYIFK